MEEGMKENISMTRKKEKESFIGIFIPHIDFSYRPDGRKYEGDWKNGK